MTDREDGEEPDPDASSIDPAQLYERLARGEPVEVLDLRDRDEVVEWAIEGSNVDLRQAPAVRFVQAEVQDTVAEEAKALDLSEPVVVCAEGEASARVATLLADAGVDAVDLAGGMEAWARLLVAHELPGDPTVVQYLRPSSGCLSYLIVDGGEAMVVDPLRSHVERYLSDARERGAEVVAVIDTHVHADHVSGLQDLAEAAGVEPTLPAGAVDRGLQFEADLLEDGDRIAVGDVEVEAIAAPGHTSEMTALRVGEVLVSGDSLFLGSVARPDLEADADPREAARTLYRTLHDRLLSLPGDTVVAPGHVASVDARREDGTYTATLDAVAGDLDLLDLDREAFVDRVSGDLPPPPANADVIVDVNLGRGTVGASRAFELELGPNHCAATV